MLIVKRFILWVLLFFMAITQLLLYLPDFSCSISTGLPLCIPQFNVNIVTGSRTTKDFVSSVRQFLRLISYLAIDMGWSKYLADPHIYNEENLVDTFDTDNLFKINYFGFCKKTSGKTKYCVANGDCGMDVLGILVRDVGLQLGRLTQRYENNTRILGDSLVFTYHLGLSSMRKFLRNDNYRNNAFSKLLLATDDQPYSNTRIKNYAKGVTVAYTLVVVNKIMFYMHLAEITISAAFVVAVLGFGFVLIFGKHHTIMPFLLKGWGSVLMISSTSSYLATIVYLGTLKLLEPTEMLDTQSQVAGHVLNNDTHSNNWDLLQTTVGSGFVISCFRYIVQCLMLPLVFIAANRYTKAKDFLPAGTEELIKV